jgi:glycosyltransferase involved in cell wall biosynthesis
VGPVADASLPRDPGFEHVEAVPQNQLPEYYRRGDVFALASREEGLAMVQVQALACGLEIVCTTHTGGEDLRRWAVRPDAISVVAPDDPIALSQALAAALQRRPAPGTQRDLLGPNRTLASWRAYAERYLQRIAEELGPAQLRSASSGLQAS